LDWFQEATMTAKTAARRPTRRTRHVRAPQSPRWRRRREARPAELLEAAVEVFVERGYSATRLEDVARRAGVTKGTMYLYFTNKEALFKEVVRSTALPVVESIEELARSHHGSARDLVTLVLRRRWEAMINGPLGGIAKLMMSEAANFPEMARWYHSQLVSRVQDAMARVIDQGIENGEFRRVDAQRAAYLAAAPLLVAAMWKQSFGRCTALPFDLDSYLEGHLEMFLRGLERRPGDEAAL